jgi:hypothetical protein
MLWEQRGWLALVENMVKIKNEPRLYQRVQIQSVAHHHSEVQVVNLWYILELRITNMVMKRMWKSIQGITVAQEVGSNSQMSMRLMKITMIMMVAKGGASVKVAVVAIEERAVEKEDLVALIDLIEVKDLTWATDLIEERGDLREALNQDIDHQEQKKLPKIQLKTSLTQS